MAIGCRPRSSRSNGSAMAALVSIAAAAASSIPWPSLMAAACSRRCAAYWRPHAAARMVGASRGNAARHAAAFSPAAAGHHVLKSSSLCRGTADCISPDGRQVAFVAEMPRGRPRLWVRSLGDSEAQPLRGTDDAIYPFWSPDSRSLGFFAQGKLKTIEIGGGPPRTLSDAPLDSRGGTWGQTARSYSLRRRTVAFSGFPQQEAPLRR